MQTEAEKRAKLNYYLKHKTPDEYYLRERRENYNPEDWMPLPRCKDYEISRYGDIYFKGNVESEKRRKSQICTQHTNKLGYKTVALNYDGKKTREYVHILVAEAWIPNPDNKPEIDHIIPVREGGTNAVENLRRVTHKENHRTKARQSQVHTGFRHTEETKRKISQTEKGMVKSEETRKKISEARMGWKPTEETRKKMSEAQKGKYINHPSLSKPVAQYTLEGQFIVIYPSAMEAARQTGANYSCISECCYGKRNKSGGYKWQFVE